MVQVRASAADGSEVSSPALCRVSLPTANDAAGTAVHAVAARPPSVPTNAWKWFLVFEAVVALIYFPFGIPSG